MRVYTVHLRQPGPDEDLVFIREGFSFWAFLLTWAWALWNQLWLFAGALIVANLAIAGTVVVVGLPSDENSSFMRRGAARRFLDDHPVLSEHMI